MSKRKNKLTAAQKSEKAQAVIADSRKPTLTIDNLPTWLQGIALSRFKWIQWIAFLPLLIAFIASPMLQNEVPAALGSSAGMVNKNVLFLVPFCCLIVAYFCWISIRTRRRVDKVSEDVEKFAVMEMETILGGLIVIAICTVVTLWQVFVAFH